MVGELASMVERGQYLLAWQQFEELMMHDRDSLSVGDLARAYLYAAISRANSGYPHSARDLCVLAGEYARTAEDDDLLGRVLLNQAEALRRIGEIRQAREIIDEFFSGNYPQELRGRAHYNRAIIRRSMHERGHGYFADLDQAAMLLETQFQERPDATTATHAAMALQMAAWTAYEIGEVEDGLAYYQRAAVLVVQAGFAGDHPVAREQLLLELHRRYREAQDLDQVIDIAQEFLAPGAPNTPEQEFWARWFAGMVCVRTGHVHAARVMWLACRDLATQLAVPSFMNRAAELFNHLKLSEGA